MNKHEVEVASEAPADQLTIVLAAVGGRKIEVVKEVRAITALDLAGAVDLVKAAPTIIKERVGKEEAEKIKATLEKVGAKIEFTWAAVPASRRPSLGREIEREYPGLTRREGESPAQLRRRLTRMTGGA